MIISISGFIGSGKDTVADYLVSEYGFKRESFASSLKDAVSVVFNWPRDMLEGLTSESRAWREQPDVWWSERLGMHITPRMVLQQWGTEVIRSGFHDDMWIASLENRLRTTTDNIVITDCRFPNEMTALRNLGATVIRVTRGPEPAWYDLALENKDLMPAAWPEVHASEYSWVGSNFDAVIYNNGSLEDLYNSVTSLVQDLPGSTLLDDLLSLQSSWHKWFLSLCHHGCVCLHQHSRQITACAFSL